MEIHGPDDRPDRDPEPLRRLYLTPILLGLTLIGLGMLMIAWPLLAAILLAVPLWAAGVALIVGGLTLRRGLRDWQTRVRRVVIQRWGPEDREI